MTHVNDELKAKLTPSVVKSEMRFRDLDALGHVNNAVYNTLAEMGRCRYLEDAGVVELNGVFSRNFPFTLARIEIDFLAPLFFPSEVKVETIVTKIGNKSAVMDFQIVTDQVAARGKQVVVWFDHNTQKPGPIPQQVRDIFEKALVPGGFEELS